MKRLLGTRLVGWSAMALASMGLLTAGCEAAKKKKDSADTSESTDATDAKDVTDATDAVDSTDSNDATDAADAVDAADATEASDAADAVEAADVSDGLDAVDAGDAVDASDGNDGSDGVEAVDGSDGNDGKDVSDAIDALDVSDGTDGGDFCGGFAGFPCEKGEYCHFEEEAQCGAGDQGGTCKPMPEVCPEIFSPVCGCDGQSYGNSCEAHGAGTSVAPDEWCETSTGTDCGGLLGLACAKSEFCNYPEGAFCGAADQTGTCEPIPEVCTDEFAPVCGCDGNTYSNGCDAHASGVSIASKGACGSSVGECGGFSGGECEDGYFCKYDVEQKCGASETPGECVKAGGDICPPVIYPVCGCDGDDYLSPCDAHNAGTSVAFTGECAKGPPETGCGGWLGDTCTSDEYCAYEPGEWCGWADASSVCKPQPDFCPANVEPVCGCDSKTYSNACAANAAGVGILTLGECDAVP